ncbi:MAG TPA: hypothetical protein VEB63_07900 [Chitinophagaceae bacterium]|nr:hypothetical protein [Chitinophagaceae bacterium]
MSNALASIKHKVGSIQFGLLRFHEQNRQQTLQVKVAENDGPVLNCVVTDPTPRKTLLNKHVNLIQKYHDDYLYIAGRVTEEGELNKKVLAVQITKACWFVRKSKGSVSWLQQKHVYDPLQQNEEAA